VSLSVPHDAFTDLAPFGPGFRTVGLEVWAGRSDCRYPTLSIDGYRCRWREAT